MLVLLAALAPSIALLFDRDVDSGRASFAGDFEPPRRLAPPQEDVLSRLLSHLVKLRDLAKDPVLESVGKIDSEVESNVRSILKDAPGQMVSSIKGVVEKASNGDIDLSFVRGADSADYETAIDALSAIKKALDASPAVKKLASKAFEVLDKQDLLGEGPLSTAISILAASAAGTLEVVRAASGKAISLRMPGLSITFDKLGNYRLNAKMRNPLWAKSAVELAVSGAEGSLVESASVRVPIAASRSVTVSPYASYAPDEKRAGVDVKVKFA